MRTRQILKEYNYRPSRGLAQNFLVNESLLNRISQLAHLGPDDTVVEIGAGPGNLTRRLARFAGKVIAIEADEELTLIHKAESTDENVEVICADALEFDFGSLPRGQGKLKLVANLPYNITTPLLFKLLERPELFSEMLILVQAEVANRIAAEPGSRKYGILSVVIQLWADAKIVLTVDPKNFSPRPKVNSALLRLTMLDKPRSEIDDPEFFQSLVKASFSKRRKTLKNALLKSPQMGIDQDRLLEALDLTGIDPGCRAETLSIENFAALANALVGQTN